MANMKLPFTLEKPSDDVWVTEGKDVLYKDGKSVKDALDEGSGGINVPLGIPAGTEKSIEITAYPKYPAIMKAGAVGSISLGMGSYSYGDRVFSFTMTAPTCTVEKRSDNKYNIKTTLGTALSTHLQTNGFTEDQLKIIIENSIYAENADVNSWDITITIESFDSTNKWFIGTLSRDPTTTSLVQQCKLGARSFMVGGANSIIQDNSYDTIFGLRNSDLSTKPYNTLIGSYNLLDNATQSYSTILGFRNKGTGGNVNIIGQNNNANGYSSIIGYQNTGGEQASDNTYYPAFILGMENNVKQGSVLGRANTTLKGCFVGQNNTQSNTTTSSYVLGSSNTLQDQTYLLGFNNTIYNNGNDSANIIVGAANISNWGQGILILGSSNIARYEGETHASYRPLIIGYNNTFQSATNEKSVLIGEYNTSNYNNVTCLGFNNISTADYQTLLGNFVNATGYKFAVGDGTSKNNKHTIFGIKDDGFAYANEKKLALQEDLDKVELVKSPNVTIFGELTNQNGQISDFSTSNYAQFPFLVDFKDRAFEINMCFTTGSNVTTQENIFDSIDGLAFAVRNGKFVIAMSSDGNTWNMGEHIGSQTITPNTTYYVKFSWNRLVYKLEISTDKISYIEDIKVTDTRSLFAKQIIIGKSTNDSNYFTGSINLNYCTLYIMGNEVWQGMDDVGLSTRLATDLSNIDAAGETKIKDVINSNLNNTTVKSIEDYETGEYKIGVNFGKTLTDWWNNLEVDLLNIFGEDNERRGIRCFPVNHPIHAYVDSQQLIGKGLKTDEGDNYTTPLDVDVPYITGTGLTVETSQDPYDEEETKEALAIDFDNEDTNVELEFEFEDGTTKTFKFIAQEV